MSSFSERRAARRLRRSRRRSPVDAGDLGDVAFGIAEIAGLLLRIITFLPRLLLNLLT